jgi:hypothetical protein
MTALRIALVVIFLMPLPTTRAWSTMCEQETLEQVTAQADAIFSGRILSVRFIPNGITGLHCAAHTADAAKCGAKIAAIAEQRVWKGDPHAQVLVYSEDWCYCTGTYFQADDEMLLVVRRYYGLAYDSHRPDYRTAFCHRSMPIKAARDQGIVDQLDLRFSGEK